MQAQSTLTYRVAYIVTKFIGYLYPSNILFFLNFPGTPPERFVNQHCSTYCQYINIVANAVVEIQI